MGGRRQDSARMQVTTDEGAERVIMSKSPEPKGLDGTKRTMQSTICDGASGAVFAHNLWRRRRRRIHDTVL